MRKVTALFILVVCAYTDCREQNIYVAPVFAGGLVGVLMSLRDFAGSDVCCTEQMFVSFILFPMALEVIMILFSTVSKGMIGKGDGYVCGSIGFVIGMRDCLGMILFSTILIGVFSAFAVAFCGWESKRRIPLAPFLLTGYLLSLTGALP